MKMWLKPAASILIAGSLLMGGAYVNGSWGVVGTATAAESNFQTNVVSVQGKGEITVKPDVAYLSIGVVTKAKTAQEAQKTNGEKAAKLTKLLKETWGINEKDIQTGQFSVRPDYTYNDKTGAESINGYTARYSLDVTYRNLDKVGELLDAASAAGANQIDDIRFGAEKPEQYEEQVIQKAMADAGRKAGILTKAAGRTLGQAVSISLENASMPSISVQYKAVNEVAMDSAGSTPVEAGEIELRTTVNVVYEMK
ncbi:SIMPL domain-containing protein [Paenibacillus macerans]|uniref:SIMPL domain-containing protein n=1 Tax=Paenibacillus macerans TaxID=44252 RepID=UPI002DBD7ABE|nr:SIMPL domain-containing protein [Paenibacillus macerans]MEC0136596.1 SIMPL domain-containing protein [Paenibacillus macerans]